MTPRPPAGAPSSKQTVIKRYANRRLYNSRTGQYVSRKSLEEMAIQGEEFVVEDTTTGEDISTQYSARSLWRRRPCKRSLCCQMSSCGDY